MLLGGLEPQFTVEVSAEGATYHARRETSSLAEVTGAWHAALRYQSRFVPVLIGVIVAIPIALAIKLWLVIPVLIGGIALLSWSSLSAQRRRRVAVLFRMDPPVGLAFESLTNGVKWLANSRKVWIVPREAPVRPATPETVERVGTHVTVGDVPSFVTNVPVPAIDGGEALYFFPDALVLRDRGGNFTNVPYPEITVGFDTIQFSESDDVPSDAQRVGGTWRYANKDGSPDRRRANNHEIPVLEYGRITLSWVRSSRVLMISSAAAARHFADSLQRRARLGMPEIKTSLEVKMPAPVAIQTGPTELERALQASIVLKQRLEEKRRIEELAPQPAGVRTAAEWIPQDRSATVHGFATGEFVYVGSRLSALDGSGTEPSLINPALPVDPAVANTSGAGMTYWPSYQSISAASRRALLEWLAGGRKDPNAYIGYVFIFFYGLERRVYEYRNGRGSSGDEVLAIGREVVRLLDVYKDKSGSFAAYASSFLELIASVEPRARELVGGARPLRRILGELSLAGKPIPAAHALEWVRSTWVLNTPATRCAEEFELLFHIRYAKQFGEGMIIKPNKTYLDASYRPASAALETIALPGERIPDVMQLARPLEKLIGLAQECCTALDPFSRFLGKNPNGRQALAGFALLPDELVEATPSADATALAALVRSRLDEDGRAHLAAGELLQFVRLAKPEKVSKNEAMLLAQALEKLGYGIEPDVRLGGPVYDVDGRVVVFRRLDDCPAVASDEYALATLLMRLAALVTAADDAVSRAERDLLEHHIEERLQLTPGERQRLAAHLAWLLEADLGTTGLKRRLESVPASGRRAIGKLLVEVAAIDGHVDAREMKILEKLYDLLELPEADLYRDVHVEQSQDDEPIVVSTRAETPTGFAIPPKPVPATTATGIDMERVRLKIAETRQVSTLLSGIFVEEETPAAPAPVMSEANTIGTLDAAHSELLRRLATRESWPREEIERLAEELSLLTDGALETLNDYAYATADDALWEDDDPVAINSKVAMELIA